MDHSGLMDMMANMMGGKGGKDLPGGIDAMGMQEMAKMMQQVDKDPKMKQEMEGYWKMLDNMN